MNLRLGMTLAIACYAGALATAAAAEAQADASAGAATGLGSAGPGDPTTTRPSGTPSAGPIAAGLNGELYVLAYDPIPGSGTGGIWRVPLSGAPTQLMSDPGVCGQDMVVDTHGDIICTNYGLFRVDGETGEFGFFSEIRGATFSGITIGPDGSVWALKHVDYANPMLVHLDASGSLLGEIPFPILATRLAFSPEGVLHYLDGAQVRRMNPDRSITTVYEGDGTVLRDLAFDAAGAIYLLAGSGAGAHIRKLTADYQVAFVPFAGSGIEQPYSLAFLRDADGMMTNRLVTANAGTRTCTPSGCSYSALAGRVVEVAAGSADAPGLEIGAVLDVTAERLVQQLVDGDGLGEAGPQYLDFIGNANGRFDLGDASVWMEENR